MKLSVAMIVKNEEKNLRRTLEALQLLNNKIDYEIIIVDTGSTDSTMDIARNFTNKVYEHPWNGNFADMRNISIKYCTGDWILVLDADEVLENPDELVCFMKSDKARLFKSAKVNLKNITTCNEEKFVYGSLIRMFKNSSDLKYVGRVHEQVEAKTPTANTKISFLHYGYSREDYEVMRYKYERNKKLLLQDLKEQKGDNRIYTLFQLSQTYSMANEYKEAMKYIKEAYDLTINRKDGLINTYVLHFYAKELYRMMRYEEAIKVALRGIQYNKVNLDYYYILSLSYFSLKEYKKAEKYMNIYFKIIEGREKNIDEYFQDDNSLTESSYADLDIILEKRVMCYYELKNFEKVVEFFEKIEKKESIELLDEIYLYSCVKVKKLNKIKEYYKDRKFEDSDTQKIINIIERVELEKSKSELKKIISNLKSLDKSLEYYLSLIYDQKSLNDEEINIDFEKFCFWKAEVLRVLVKKDKHNILLIKNCKSIDVERYITMIIKNFECLKALYEFVEESFLVTDFKSLNFITLIEEKMLLSSSIEENKYSSLNERARINRINLLKYMYNKEMFENNYIYNILSEYDNFILKINANIKCFEKDEIKYINILKKQLKETPNFKGIINYYLNKINENVISDAMIEEKDNVLIAVEQLINENNLKEAKSILEELESVFVYDAKINNYLGVIYYMLGDYKQAILRMAKAEELSEDKFDARFNLGCILENMNRIDDAKYYYKRAYEVCNDEQMKMEIKNILNK